MNIANPVETERTWMNALEQDNTKSVGYIKGMTEKGRALTPEEIVAVINYIHTLDQYFSKYVPTADALSGLGHPALSQRLTQVRQDLSQSLAIYNDMYRSAEQFQSQWRQTQMQAQAEMFRSMQEAHAHTQAVYDQMNRLNSLVNEGVPYNEALLLSRQPY